MLKILTNQCPGGEKGVCVCVWGGGGGGAEKRGKWGCAAAWNLAN